MSKDIKEILDYFKEDVQYLEEELKNPNFLGRYITIRDKECGYLKKLLDYITNLQQENKQLKEELQQFQSDFEKQEGEVFNELEQAINELDLSDKTKNYLIELMNKDVIIVFGIVEDKIQELKEKYK